MAFKWRLQVGILLKVNLAAQTTIISNFPEIEAKLLTNPKIRDCGVIGKPDEAAGELAMAFVVRTDESLSESDVIKFVNESASPAKKIRGGVVFVDQIPKSPAGKILRRELRDVLKKLSLKSKL